MAGTVVCSSCASRRRDDDRRPATGDGANNKRVRNCNFIIKAVVRSASAFVLFEAAHHPNVCNRASARHRRRHPHQKRHQAMRIARDAYLVFGIRLVDETVETLSFFLRALKHQFITLSTSSRTSKTKIQSRNVLTGYDSQCSAFANISRERF